MNGWTEYQNGYLTQMDIKESIPAGYYKMLFHDPSVEVKPLQMREVKVFTTGDDSCPLYNLQKTIAKFFDSADKYKSLGIAHKLGLCLYGPPGMGKSTALQHTINEMIKQNCLVCQVDRFRKRAFEEIYKAEPKRKLIFIVEDIDNHFEDPGDDMDFCEILDGTTSKSNVVFITTTNNYDKIPSRLLRFGRLEQSIFFGPPSDKWRHSYIEHKLQGINRLDLFDKIYEATFNLPVASITQEILNGIDA